MTDQSNNTVHGDMAAGNINKFNIDMRQGTTLNELTLLYARLRAAEVDEKDGSGFCEKLNHYLATPTEGDVRGLEAKLRESGRTDQLYFAMSQKEQAAKMVMRQQSSRVAQRIYTILLDELHTNYMLVVTPVIEAGGDRVVVDAAINSILHNISSMLGENFLEISVKDLLGLLYFLGGNCHIRWDKYADLPSGL
ncbi:MULTISPECIES: ABC-three component system protein [Pseudomonas]|uniref:ABC-three component system protein n=1 Tax=Pseudomonas TaxID=286 RepID=UPI001FF4C1A4